MRGPKLLRQTLADHLTARMPTVIADALAEWGATGVEVPVMVTPYDREALDRTPMMIVNVTRAASFRRVDVTATGDPAYRARYTVRLYSWVKALEQDETLRIRDDYAVIVRALLLSQPSLGDPEHLLLDEGSLVEEYPDAVAVKGDRWVAGAVHSFDVQVDEEISSAPIGSASSILTDADAVTYEGALA